MKSVRIRVVLISLVVIGFIIQVKAQKGSNEPVFGSVVVKKNELDSTKKKSNFHLFRPVFIRIGTMGGVLFPFENPTNNEVGGTMGLRVEYGFSNIISLVGEVQANGSDGSTFSSTQASLGINLMPFKSRRLQPYVGTSIGIGSNNGNDNNNMRKNGEEKTNEVDQPEMTNERNGKSEGLQVFGQMRLGLNYVLAKRFISTLETGYQLPFNNFSTSNGGLIVRVGFGYQLGRTKK